MYADFLDLLVSTRTSNGVEVPIRHRLGILVPGSGREFGKKLIVEGTCGAGEMVMPSSPFSETVTRMRFG